MRYFGILLAWRPSVGLGRELFGLKQRKDNRSLSSKLPGQSDVEAEVVRVW